jgi:hypothetical protein
VQTPGQAALLYYGIVGCLVLLANFFQFGVKRARRVWYRAQRHKCEQHHDDPDRHDEERRAPAFRDIQTRAKILLAKPNGEEEHKEQPES